MDTNEILLNVLSSSPGQHISNIGWYFGKCGNYLLFAESTIEVEVSHRFDFNNSFDYCNQLIKLYCSNDYDWKIPNYGELLFINSVNNITIAMNISMSNVHNLPVHGHYSLIPVLRVFL